MSWQVKDEATEMQKLSGQLDKIRDSLFINNEAQNLAAQQSVGGPSGTNAPNSGGQFSGIQSYQPSEVTITDIDSIGIPTFVFDKINVETSNMIIKSGGGSLDVKWIQQTLNDGQYLIIKPESGTTITLKTGGNLHIGADITVADTEFVIAVFYEEETSPSSEGNYVIHKFSGGGGGGSGYDTIQDEGSNLTQRNTINFTGAGVTASDDFFGTKTEVNIPGAVASQTPWLQPIQAAGFDLRNMPDWFMDAGLTLGISGNAQGITIFDQNVTNDIQTIVGTGVGGFPQFVVTNVSVELNAPLDTNLVNIQFQGNPVPAPPGGLHKRLLFCNSADNDKLMARSPAGIIDLEGLITNMGNLNNSQITQDLNFVAASFATVDFDGNNISLTATGGFQTLPGNPVAFLIIKVGGANFKIPYYSP